MFLKQLFGLFTNNRRTDTITCHLFSLIHINRRVCICSVILQRELLNVQIPFATYALFISSLFFKIVLIVDLAIPYSALRSPLFPVSRLEIIYFFKFFKFFYFAGSWLKL
jgi:hypothetical protein